VEEKRKTGSAIFCKTSWGGPRKERFSEGKSDPSESNQLPRKKRAYYALKKFPKKKTLC